MMMILRKLRYRLNRYFLLIFATIVLLIYLKATRSSRHTKNQELSDNKNIPKIVPPPIGGAKNPIKLIDYPVSSSEPGENGLSFPINRDAMSPEEQEEYDKGFEMNSFNQFASDRISLRRKLPDNRFDECKNMKYQISVLPDASVIICFHNEAMSTLLRTVYSVIDRTPQSLLKEVILVDDGSTLDFLKNPLKEYVDSAFEGLVKIVRTIERVGLIKARLEGAEAAHGKVLIFLDSHCEATEGWITPLLYTIYKDEATIVAPNVNAIDDKTMTFIPNSEGLQVGGFTWSLVFTWHFPTETDLRGRKSPADPIRSPTISGGLFAVSKKYFFDLGSYDPGMDIWGAENLEISFRTWMCHGTVYIHPCSLVGHIFRSRSPYAWRSEKDVYTINNLRLAHAWLDDYKPLYLDKIGNKKNTDYGDISNRLAIRKELKCHSFDWYLNNVYPSMFNPKTAKSIMEIRNIGFDQCLDANEDGEGQNNVGIYPCHGHGGNQFWYFTKTGELRKDEKCLDSGFSPIMISTCHSSLGNQEFKMNSDGTIMHYNSKNCIAVSQDGKSLAFEKCLEEDRFRWNLKYATI